MWWRPAPGQPWIEAHASAGASGGATRWGLADLRVSAARRESQYVFVQNIDAMAASVDVTVYTSDGALTRAYAVGAHSRLTIDVAADFPDVADAVASAVIRSSVPVVVEASRYWDVEGVLWSAGVNVRATPLP